MSRDALHSDENKALVAILIEAREAAGLTQAELGERIKKRQQFISRLEKADRRVDLLEFIMIARALKLDPRELFARVLRKLPKSFEV
jgi:transcriptional regulator with XRE-family HTH domain